MERTRRQGSHSFADRSRRQDGLVRADEVHDNQWARVCPPRRAADGDRCAVDAAAPLAPLG